MRFQPLDDPAIFRGAEGAKLPGSAMVSVARMIGERRRCRLPGSASGKFSTAASDRKRISEAVRPVRPGVARLDAAASGRGTGWWLSSWVLRCGARQPDVAAWGTRRFFRFLASADEMADEPLSRPRRIDLSP